MSASREKQVRKDIRENNPETGKRNYDSARRGAVIIISVIIALFIVVAVVVGSGVLHHSVPVMSVADVSITPSEFNYTYVYFMNYYYDMYGQYTGQAPFDTTKSLSRQYIQTGVSWLEYLNDATYDTLYLQILQCNAAKKQGITLTDEDIAQINTTLANIHTSAENAGMSDDEFLARNVGQGLTAAIVRVCEERTMLANRFNTATREGYAVSDADVDAYYESHKNDYDVVTYHSFNISKTPTVDTTKLTDEEKAAENEKAAAAAKAKAEEALAKVTTPELFEALANEIVPPTASATEETEEEPVDETLRKNTAQSSISSEDAKNWLFDSARVAGDKTTIESDNAITVYLFVSRQIDPTKVVDVRHILIKNGAKTDEEKKAARAKADELLAQWKAGDATEDSFATLAKENSEDGNAQDGGIYEKVTKGQMVESFDTWIFDENRKKGDTDVVDTEFGSHVMYWVGDHLEYRGTIRSTIETDKYTALMEELKTATELKKGSFGAMITNWGK